MSYFSEHYKDVSYPVANGAGGLYNAQLGAIHAVASHFTLDDRPALVSMPTGSGKTAVLMLTPFILRSIRVLVITPSRLVCGQIADDFKSLRTLTKIGALPIRMKSPKVLERKTRVGSSEEWEALRQFDVVVSTPNCASPEYEGIPAPPPDLFDLVLVDEAHHSPAKTWAGLLDAYQHVPRVLFTATPFRRDRGEIPGRFIYSYPVARAFKDGVFGRISYISLEPAANTNPDVAIAQRAEAVLLSDRAAGLNHCLMVRTDRRRRADELEAIYADNTELRLAVVHSGQSSVHADTVLAQLAAGDLDGIICVNMLGEGFDFPRLKIAAIHAPHKSLEVTLQFIGRFARTNSQEIGEAKFVAIPSEIELERARLFEEGAIWQELIAGLSHARIAEEQEIRETLDELDSPDAREPDLSDLSLYSLYPRSHVKIYDVSAPITCHEPLDLGPAREVVYRNVSRDGSIIVIIVRERGRPRWSSVDQIMDVRHELLVLYYDSKSGLLFINASRSIDGLYQVIANTLSPDARPLPTSAVRRVVKDIKDARVFNVGMRNIQAANSAESYKIIAAPDAGPGITATDSRIYRQGHAFLTGESGGEKTTIGYSSTSKVWSAHLAQIPHLLQWCRVLGAHIRSTGKVVTNSGLDFLDAGKVVDKIPSNVIFAQWPKEALDYNPPVLIEYTTNEGRAVRGHILDLEIAIDRGATTSSRLRIDVTGDGLEFPLDFTVDDFFTSPTGEDSRVVVARGGSKTTLVEFLNESYLNFYTADGALFSGNELFEPQESSQAISLDQLEPWDWSGVSITREVGDGKPYSIHHHIRQYLAGSGATVVLDDHGPGEIADCVELIERDGAMLITFYHCKKSGGPQPGARVDDVYEVCGQAQKSVAYASLPRLEQRLKRRRGKTRFVAGDADLLKTCLERARGIRRRFEIVVVQPGIKKTALTVPMGEVLGATSEHLRRAGCDPLRVICS